MIRKILLVFLLFLPVTVFALPNPASVYCVAKRNSLLLIQQTGICVFKDHSYCEEWSYFRHTCKPGQLFWPEKTIEYKNLRKYCVGKDNNDVSVVVICEQKKKE